MQGGLLSWTSTDARASLCVPFALHHQRAWTELSRFYRLQMKFPFTPPETCPCIEWFGKAPRLLLYSTRSIFTTIITTVAHSPRLQLVSVDPGIRTFRGIQWYLLCQKVIAQAPARLEGIILAVVGYTFIRKMGWFMGSCVAPA